MVQEIKSYVITVIEDKELIRENLAQFLNHINQYKCDENFESFESFFKNINKRVLPNLVIADIGLPGMSGIEGITLLKQKYPSIDILMFTIYNDSDKIFDSLCAGASGYLLKNTPLNEIKESIDIIRTGGSIMSPSIARKVTDYFTRRSKTKEFNELTTRENDVVKALVDGLSYKLIADRLGISIDTVRSYIKSIYKKLYINSKAELIKRAIE